MMKHHIRRCNCWTSRTGRTTTRSTHHAGADIPLSAQNPVCQQCKAVKFGLLGPHRCMHPTPHPRDDISRHHCRSCGEVVCATCSSRRHPDYGSVRICTRCYSKFIVRESELLFAPR